MLVHSKSISFTSTMFVDNRVLIPSVQDTQQAWVVAGQLLVPERQADEQFIGAQIIIQKLETQFDVIEAKDA